MPRRHPENTLTVNLHGGLDGVQRFEPESRRRPARRFSSGGPIAGRRSGHRDEAITEAPSRTSVTVRERLYRRLLVLADGFAAILALVLAVTVLGDDRLKLATFAAVPVVILINKMAGLYERDELVLRRSTLDEAPMLFQLAAIFALVTWLLEDRIIDGVLHQRQVFGLWAVAMASFIGGRMLARYVAARRATTERCLVIGTAEVANRMREKMRDSHVNADVVATLPLAEGHNLAVLDGTASFRHMVTQLEIDRVILAPISTDSADMLELIRIAKAVGVRVSVLPRMLEVVGTSVEFDDLDGLAMLGIRRFGLPRSSRWLKRASDLVGAGFGVIVVSPLLAVIALAIWLDSGGPVLFRQTRVGRDGRRFKMIKFRSMVPDAENRLEALLDQNEAVGLFKMAADPRITTVGRFLRRSSLDELPQLFNVLKGEMSLVGPRPLVVHEDAQVEGLLRSRLHLTPGMTGPWQVMGSARIPMKEMVKIDYRYVASWSLWTDVKLLLRTVPHMLANRGM